MDPTALLSQRLVNHCGIRPSSVRNREPLLYCCHNLGIVINWKKSYLELTSKTQFLRMLIDPSKDVAADLGPHDLVGAVCSMGQDDVPPSLVAEVALVSRNSWSCDTSPLIRGVPGCRRRGVHQDSLFRWPLFCTPMYRGLAGEHIYWT